MFIGLGLLFRNDRRFSLSGFLKVPCHYWAAAELISAPAANINGKNVT